MSEWERRDRDAPRRSYRGVGPRGYRRSDERILEDVSERLLDDPSVDATSIEVSVQDGEVTLQGAIDSRWARRRAEDIVEEVSGVTHVQNNLRVWGREREAGVPRDDRHAMSGAAASGGYGTTAGAATGVSAGATRDPGTSERAGDPMFSDLNLAGTDRGGNTSPAGERGTTSEDGKPSQHPGT